MAQEIVNRMLAAVKCAADGTILARTGNVLSVTAPGGGIYVVTLTEGIGRAECAIDSCSDGATPHDIMVSQLSATQFQVEAATPAGGPENGAFNLAIHRLSSSNGT